VQAVTPLEISLHEEGLRLVNANGECEIPLSHRLDAQFLRSKSNARLVAERILEAWPDEFSQGGRVSLRLPLSFSLLRLQLPYSLKDFPNPEHQIVWEIDCNAPDVGSEYAYDWQELDGQIQVLAMRRSHLRFYEFFFENLGQKLDALSVENETPVFEFQPSRSREHDASYEKEIFKKAPRPMLWTAVASLVLLVAAFSFSPLGTNPLPSTLSPKLPSVKQDLAVVAAPVADTLSAPGDRSFDETDLTKESSATSAADTIAAARETITAREPVSPLVIAPPLATPSAVTSPVAMPRGDAALTLAWKRLVADLAKSESDLPSFFVVDAGGILVRQGPDRRESLDQLLSRAARVSQVAESAYWVHFDQPLHSTQPGQTSFRPSVEGVKAKYYVISSLENLPNLLSTSPVRMIFQRRWTTDSGGSTVAWRFEKSLKRLPKGWRVRIFMSEES
jgi:hypothetical protein